MLPGDRLQGANDGGLNGPGCGRVRQPRPTHTDTSDTTTPAFLSGVAAAIFQVRPASERGSGLLASDRPGFRDLRSGSPCDLGVGALDSRLRFGRNPGARVSGTRGPDMASSLTLRNRNSVLANEEARRLQKIENEHKVVIRRMRRWLERPQAQHRIDVLGVIWTAEGYPRVREDLADGIWKDAEQCLYLYLESEERGAKWPILSRRQIPR